MVRTCSVKHCGSRENRDSKRFFELPSNLSRNNPVKVHVYKERRRLWLDALGLLNENGESANKFVYVCEDHFIAGEPAKWDDTGNVDWVPRQRMNLAPRSPKTLLQRLQEAHERREMGKARRKMREQLKNINKERRNQTNEEERAAKEMRALERVQRKQSKEDRKAERNATSLKQKRDEKARRQEARRLQEEEKQISRVEVQRRMHEEELQRNEAERCCKEDRRKSAEMARRAAEELMRVSADPPPVSEPELVVTKDAEDYHVAISVNTQTALTMLELKNAIAELTDLRDIQRFHSLGEDWLSQDTNETLFYTGLPSFELVMCVFRLIEPHMHSGPQSSVGKFQSFLMTLMILRLNLNFADVGYRFCVDRTVVSRHFSSCLSLLYIKLKNFIIWPERDVLKQTMPLIFRESFGDKVSLIIDCFEVFTEAPQNLLAKVQCWSQYKHHTTVKVLIGITPQGSVAYLSPAWSGRTSDKHLTENCGVLDKLRPGDLILADRGFTIHDAVGLALAEIRIPAFMKGKNKQVQQLSPQEVESTRKLAHVRIHVERVIGSLRQKYTILHRTLPMSTLRRKVSEVQQFNEILTVCSLLLNLCPSVVPFN